MRCTARTSGQYFCKSMRFPRMMRRFPSPTQKPKSVRQPRPPFVSTFGSLRRRGPKMWGSCRKRGQLRGCVTLRPANFMVGGRLTVNQHSGTPARGTGRPVYCDADPVEGYPGGGSSSKGAQTRAAAHSRRVDHRGTRRPMLCPCSPFESLPQRPRPAARPSSSAHWQTHKQAEMQACQQAHRRTGMASDTNGWTWKRGEHAHKHTCKRANTHPHAH